jgi:hypothetical protein
MRTESLEELKRAFDRWRKKKRYMREAIPGDLQKRTYRMLQVHGPGDVARATGLYRSRLAVIGRVHQTKGRSPAAVVPTFTRIELAAPAGTGRAFAEVETPAGMKVRIFRQTAGSLALLSSLCGLAGAR